MSFYDREILEEAARTYIPEEHYYELLDSMSELTDEDLIEIPGVSKSLRIG